MKKKAILIIVFVIIFCFCLAMSVKLFNKKGNIAVIYVNGKEYDRIDLQLITNSFTISLPHNKVLVEPGQISILDADCPDKLCIKQGKKSGGIPIICLPNGVSIVFEENKGADAISW